MAKVLFVQNIFFELIGTMSLSAYLRSRGHRVDLIIETSPARILEHINGTNPDVIAFSSVTGQHKTVIGISSAIKQTFPKLPIVMGGAHPTFFPEIIEKEPIDIVCRGEGEEAMADLMDRLDAGADITDIPNLWVKKEGSIVKNDVRPLVEDLDSLPYPDRTIYDKYPYLSTHPVRRFMSGRGCPYECNFCFNHALRQLYHGKGRFVRMRSQEKVIEEIKQVAELYPTMKRVKFEDDTFTLSKGWALRFLQEYKEQVHMPFACYSRADCVDDELARALKDAGCDRLDFGLETGSERIRNEILNKRLTDEQIVKAAEVLRRHGIPFGTANMFGLPGETLEDALETLKLNLKIRPYDVWGAVFQPYPGTECGRYVMEKGYCRTLDVNDIRNDYQTDSLLVQEDIREVVNLHKFFYLLVMFPASMKVIRPLLSLPGNFMFTFIHRILYFWGYATRTKGNVKQIFNDIRMAMKYK
ncbi:MAG: radical SAM protein [Candidatus Abyssobacteria bacterium SURF_17]|uniref:Radical SAM protein n=1 Tax=Candidatus Abyssobacteria bacterium SURF_17 TaxID=2093361 RepID=A0A419EYY7_9BACT|nr:MAG: radical SAM protein [Candidatus Abyssubacteria bacterium SURF_17]